MKKYDILLVDDEEDVANAMRDALLILDFYNPTIALSGNIALDMASKKSYDAFLVDQIMPIMPGTEFIKKLIEIVDDPLIYIVTAEDDGIALDAAELFPAKGGIPVKRYIQKPWQPSLFTIDLREDLRERDLKRSLLQTLKLHSSEQKEIQEELNRAQNGFAQIEKRDAAMCWQFVGTNSSTHLLTSINLTISGETLTPLSELGCAIYDLKKDPLRKNKIAPILISEDSINKNILLPFQSPGIEPNKQFEIELNYVWPAIVNIRKDYWFIDPLNYALKVEKIRFQFIYDDPIMTAAYVFRLDVVKGVAELQGSIPIEVNDHSQKCLYEVSHPKGDDFYVIIIEGNSK